MDGIIHGYKKRTKLRMKPRIEADKILSFVKQRDQ